MLDKKQIQVSSKWVIKQRRQLCNISNTFGPGIANECTVQWWVKKFCKGDESFEDECSGQPLEVGNNQLRAIIKADALRTTEVAEELTMLAIL